MTPLPDPLASILRSDSTAALAALMIIANAHKEIFAWAARMIGADELSKGESPPKPRANGAARRSTAHTYARSARKPAADYHARRRKARDRDDGSLLEAMRSAPDASIGDWAEAIGKGRSSTVSALKRLRDAGRAESVEGKWRLTALTLARREPETPKDPPPKWIDPLSGAHRARAVAHAGA